MTTNFYPETRASVIELRDEFTFATQKSTKMRHMIQYLATHDINCDSWMLGSISYTWPVEDLESRLRRYVEHRLQVFEGTAPDLSFKGTRIWECDDRIEADIRHEIFQWDSMQESEGLAATASTISSLASCQTVKRLMMSCFNPTIPCSSSPSRAANCS